MHHDGVIEVICISSSYRIYALHSPSGREDAAAPWGISLGREIDVERRGGKGEASPRC